MLHATPEGGVAPAHICRGAGSFEAVLRGLGEPLPEDEAAPAPGGEAGRQAEQSPELPQAATVS